ncbi:hypothetical protein ACPPVO_53795 [Dactylosporangium sp. McL0621]|uniref:hypothetical protein n=1 Tax=Dactylosporangium sp. McL0621 TaxID=3415678 RepID=UPI003CF002FD
MLFTVVGAAAILLGAQTAAQAQTNGGSSSAGVAWVQQDTSTGYCQAEVKLDLGTTTYVYGSFVNQHAGLSCIGWLDRSTDGGSYWYTISGYHTVGSYSTAQYDATGDYWDGIGYLARACFRLNFAGSATHCSYGIGNYVHVG